MYTTQKIKNTQLFLGVLIIVVVVIAAAAAIAIIVVVVIAVVTKIGVVVFPHALFLVAFLLNNALPEILICLQAIYLNE